MMDHCIHKGEGGNHSEVGEGVERHTQDQEREWQNEEGDGKT